MLYFPAFAVTNQFRGVNWADTRDNFVSDVLVLSGLSTKDTYESASIVANRVIGQFVELLGTNSVRLPINEPTVSSFWDTYTGVIDVGLEKGRVLLAYWGPAQSSGPKNMNDWWAMWDKVIQKYGENPNAYFEIFNEPHMYTKDELRDLYASWLERYPNVPRDHIILNGSGMAQNVPDIASDSRFDGCLFAVHEYTFWNMGITTEEGWKNALKAKVGPYADRTICTEWGGAMSPGTKDGVYYDYMDYNQLPTNYFMAYIRGIPEQLREWKMGSFYWPGLRDGDWYSMTKRVGEGANIKLEIVNQSGFERMKRSWTDTVEVKPVKQEPFGGIKDGVEIAGDPAFIPGKIEAEDYDLGGEGVAYHDNDPENQGGEYRHGGVDITTDNEGNYVVGWTEEGEWLKYTINVQESGDYYVQARVSSGLENSSFQLSIEDKAISEKIVIPKGSSWDNYQIIDFNTSPINEGQQVLTLKITGSFVNIDWLKFSTESSTTIFDITNSFSTTSQKYILFNYQGKRVAEFTMNNHSEIKVYLKQNNIKSGVFILRDKTGKSTQVIKHYQ